MIKEIMKENGLTKWSKRVGGWVLQRRESERWFEACENMKEILLIFKCI